MIKTADTHSLGALLKVFAEGKREDRLEIATLKGPLGGFFSDSVDSSGRLMASGAAAYRAHAAIAMLTRLIWSLVPTRLISSASPDVKALAQRALIGRFGSEYFDDEVTRYLTVVFKRIRTYALAGRQVQSLNLELIAHRTLLIQQGGRCNHCLYQFAASDHFYSVEDDGVPSGSSEAMDGELVLLQMFRRPELDHIVPVILGGDGEENWQILCRSCNAGKSDQISYMSLMHGQVNNRVGHLFSLTAGKRYAVIAEATRDEKPVTGDGRHFRIFRKDETGLANPENLRALYR